MLGLGPQREKGVGERVDVDLRVFARWERERRGKLRYGLGREAKCCPLLLVLSDELDAKVSGFSP